MLEETEKKLLKEIGKNNEAITYLVKVCERIEKKLDSSTRENQARFRSLEIRLEEIENSKVWKQITNKQVKAKDEQAIIGYRQQEHSAKLELLESKIAWGFNCG